MIPHGGFLADVVSIKVLRSVSSPGPDASFVPLHSKHYIRVDRSDFVNIEFRLTVGVQQSRRGERSIHDISNYISCYSRIDTGLLDDDLSILSRFTAAQPD